MSEKSQEDASRADYYRTRAQELRVQAREAKYAEARVMLLSLAQNYEHIANEVERRRDS